MKQNVSQVSGGIMINVDVSVKNIIMWKRYVWNRPTCRCENGKYLAIFMDKIISNEFVDVKETNFHESNITCKIQSFYILLTFFNHHYIIDSC